EAGPATRLDLPRLWRRSAQRRRAASSPPATAAGRRDGRAGQPGGVGPVLSSAKTSPGSGAPSWFVCSTRRVGGREEVGCARRGPGGGGCGKGTALLGAGPGHDRLHHDAARQEKRSAPAVRPADGDSAALRLIRPREVTAWGTEGGVSDALWIGEEAVAFSH